eukprot:3539029-Amphidinium_carterae.2
MDELCVSQSHVGCRPHCATAFDCSCWPRVVPFESAGLSGEAVRPEEGDSDVEVEERAEDEHAQAAAPTRSRKGPLQPSSAEREQHESAGHFPYREWCRACVMGKGRHDKHVSRISEHTIATVAFDYGYLEPRDQQVDVAHGPSPILIARESMTKMVMGELVYRKGGSDTWAVNMLSSFVLLLGHPRVTLKSDSEPAIFDLKNRVAASLRSEGVQVHIYIYIYRA